MSVVGLHPEEMLDRERRGELSAIERERLEGHVAQCSACRIERQLRADFADELASEIDDVPLPSLAGIMPRSTPAEAPRLSPRLRTRARARTLWLLVAAALVVVSAAGAGVRGRTWLRLATSLLSEPPQVEAPPPAPTQAKALRTRATAASVPSDAPDLADTATPPVLEPAAVVAPAVIAVIAPAVIAPPAPKPPSALFDAERSARLRGDYATVLALHRELLGRYPQSREAQASRATVGQLLLDRGDPTGALASFDGFLSVGNGGNGSAPLTEVALVGRATALDRLGRSEEALNAWRALIVAFPDTPYARHAAARLAP